MNSILGFDLLGRENSEALEFYGPDAYKQIREFEAAQAADARVLREARSDFRLVDDIAWQVAGQP